MFGLPVASGSGLVERSETREIRKELHVLGPMSHCSFVIDQICLGVKVRSVLVVLAINYYKAKK